MQTAEEPLIPTHHKYSLLIFLTRMKEAPDYFVPWNIYAQPPIHSHMENEYMWGKNIPTHRAGCYLSVITTL